LFNGTSSKESRSPYEERQRTGRSDCSRRAILAHQTAHRCVPAVKDSGALHSWIVPRQSILPFTPENPRRHWSCEDTRSASAVGPPPQKTGSPEPVSCDRSRPSKDRRLKMLQSPAQISGKYILPVSPFVVVYARHHPERTNESPLPCREHRSETALAPASTASDFLLRPHSPSTAFEAPERPVQAPVTKPAAAEVPALVIFFTLRITSLSRVTGRERQSLCQLSRVGKVAKPAGLLSGGRT